MHKAVFSLHVDSLLQTGQEDSDMALIDVFDRLSGKVKVQRRLRHSDFKSADFELFEMYFENAETSELDFRVTRLNDSHELSYLGTLVEGVIGGQVFYPGLESGFQNGQVSESGLELEWPGTVLGDLFSIGTRTLHEGPAKAIFFVSYTSEIENLTGPFLSIEPGAGLGAGKQINFEDLAGPGVISAIEVPFETPAPGSGYLDRRFFVNYEDRDYSMHVSIVLHRVAIVSDLSRFNQADTGSGVYHFSYEMGATHMTGNNSRTYYEANVPLGSYCRYLSPLEFNFLTGKKVTWYLGSSEDPTVSHRTTTLPYLYHGGLCQTPLRPGALFKQSTLTNQRFNYYRVQEDQNYCRTHALAIDPQVDLRNELWEPSLQFIPEVRPRHSTYSGRCDDFPEAETPQTCAPVPSQFPGSSPVAEVCGASERGFFEVQNSRDFGSAIQCLSLFTPNPNGGAESVLLNDATLRFCHAAGSYSWHQTWEDVDEPLRLPEGHFCTEFLGYAPQVRERFYLCTPDGAHIRYLKEYSTIGEPFQVPFRD
ncbi:MAG: hypothetical protein R3B54_13635 [Bdellovibrionota bacterium]